MITLTVAEDEANLIINALAALPYSQVHQLLPRLLAEANEQLGQAPAQGGDQEPETIRGETA